MSIANRFNSSAAVPYWGPLANLPVASELLVGQVYNATDGGPPFTCVATGASSYTWVQLGGEVIFRPSSLGGADDSANLRDIISSGYKSVRMADGQTYAWKTPFTCPSGFSLIGSRGGGIVSALTEDGNPATASLLAVEGSVLSATTLQANAAAGAIQVHTVATVPVGGILRFNSVATLFHAAARTVVAVSGGAGNFTVTLDEPLLEPYLTGDGVTVYSTIPSDIFIDGLGMTMTGTCERFVEFSGAYRCLVRRLRGVKTSGSDGNIFAFDVGSRECTFEFIDSDVNGHGIVGIALESSERCYVIGCNVQRATQVGIGLYDCIESGVVRSHAWSCTNAGIALIGDADSRGNINCFVDGSSANSNTSLGIQVASGSSGTRLTKNTARFNGTYGMQIGADGNNAFNSSDTGGRYTDNLTAGVMVGSLSKGTKIYQVDVTNNPTGLEANDEVDVDGLTFSNGGSIAGVNIKSGSNAKLRGLNIAYNGSAGHGVAGQAGSDVQLTQSAIAATGAGNNAVQFVTTGSISDSKLSSGSSFGIVVTGAIRMSNVTVTGSSQANDVFMNGGTLNVVQSGKISKVITSADVTPTTLEAQASQIDTTGALTGNRNLILPTIAGMEWDVFCNNTGAFSTTFKTSAGTGIVVAQGKRARLQCDGTNVVRVTPDT